MLKKSHENHKTKIYLSLKKKIKKILTWQLPSGPSWNPLLNTSRADAAHDYMQTVNQVLFVYFRWIETLCFYQLHLESVLHCCWFSHLINQNVFSLVKCQKIVKMLIPELMRLMTLTRTDVSYSVFVSVIYYFYPDFNWHNIRVYLIDFSLLHSGDTTLNFDGVSSYPFL